MQAESSSWGYVLQPVLQAALSLDGLDMDRTQECAVRENCLFKNNMALSDGQSCEAEYICPAS